MKTREKLLHSKQHLEMGRIMVIQGKSWKPARETKIKFKIYFENLESAKIYWLFFVISATLNMVFLSYFLW
jgi:hypothetical protein